MGYFFWKNVAESAIWSNVGNKVSNDTIGFKSTADNLVVKPSYFIIKKDCFCKLVASLPKVDTLHRPK